MNWILWLGGAEFETTLTHTYVTLVKLLTCQKFSFLTWKMELNTLWVFFEDDIK